MLTVKKQCQQIIKNNTATKFIIILNFSSGKFAIDFVDESTIHN